VTDLYIVDSNNQVQPAKRVRCKNEERELQDLLQKNPALLAGDQIDPDEPRRWLLIKREMPVPDPCNGVGRWAVDFLYVDQDATLTFVECKRHADTRSRREVIAQVIDYAANATRLWTKEGLVSDTIAQATVDGLSIEGKLAQLGASGFPTLDSLLAASLVKLKKNDLRVILFMEEAPPELKTIVEFMNGEMSSVEILLVEARLFDVSGSRLCAPRLWGYTETVRARRQAIAMATGDRIKWDEPLFFGDLEKRVSEAWERDVVRNLYKQLSVLGYVCKFGTGATTGSINARLPQKSNLALLTVRSDGVLTAPFGSFATPELKTLQDSLVKVYRNAGLDVPGDYQKRWVNYGIADWAPKAASLLAQFKEFGESTAVPMTP
jgi:hypothetical protein